MAKTSFSSLPSSDIDDDDDDDDDVMMPFPNDQNERHSLLACLVDDDTKAKFIEGRIGSGVMRIDRTALGQLQNDHIVLHLLFFYRIVQLLQLGLVDEDDSRGVGNAADQCLSDIQVCIAQTLVRSEQSSPLGWTSQSLLSIRPCATAGFSSSLRGEERRQVYVSAVIESDSTLRDTFRQTSEMLLSKQLKEIRTSMKPTTWHPSFFRSEHDHYDEASIRFSLRSLVMTLLDMDLNSVDCASRSYIVYLLSTIVDLFATTRPTALKRLQQRRDEKLDAYFLTPTSRLLLCSQWLTPTHLPMLLGMSGGLQTSLQTLIADYAKPSHEEVIDCLATYAMPITAPT